MTIAYGFGPSKEDQEDIITLNVKEQNKKAHNEALESTREFFCADLHHLLKVGRNNGFVMIGDIAKELRKVLDEEERDFLKTLL